MYRFGPEIDDDTVAWLKEAATFPEVLEVKLPNNHRRTYQILDRDESGRIAQLRESRRGRKGFVLRVRDPEMDDVYAAKLCIREDYKDANPLTEIEFGKLLRGLDLFAAPKLVGTVERFPTEPRNKDLPWICFISDWLEGRTLQEIVRESPTDITPSLVTHVAKQLVTAVLVLENLGYKHDDLNLGNLMIEFPDRRLLPINPTLGAQKLRVIDLGSMKPIDRATAKPDDDWSQSARCLAELHNVLHLNRAIASRHPSFLQRLRNFIAHLADDHARHFPDKSSYVRALERIEALVMIEPHQVKRFQPLDALSAEHLVDDELLKKLFVNHLPWLPRLHGINPCVLVGPRGCGKSMVFRYMATRTHITSPNSNPTVMDESGILGIYVGCSSDLGHDLVWLGGRDLQATSYVDWIVDYFNVVAARELMRTLATAAAAKNFANALSFTEHGKRGIIDFLESALGYDLRRVHVSGMEAFQSCADMLERLRLKLAREMRVETTRPIRTGTTFLRDLCGRIVEELPAVGKYTVVFLLDDYTEHRISRNVQRVINEIVFQRVKSPVFKVSSEPYGFSDETYYGSRIDPTREYVEIDAGTLCLEMNQSERRKFVSDLLDLRLQAANYRGRAKDLIGDSQHRSDLKLARAIRSFRIGKQTYYNGLHVLANAWSGDVATILLIVSDMFEDAKVDPNTVNRIPNEVQHNAIVRVSKGLRGHVQGYAPFGKEMNNVLTIFGDLANRLLVDHKARLRKARDGKHKSDINRKYRLEWTMPEGANINSELLRLDRTGDCYRLYTELIRRAIFHENLQSRGKEGEGRRTVRLQIRSSLLPSFGTSLVHENHIKIDKTEDFVEFLTQTRRWADGVIARYSTPATLIGFDLFGEPHD